MNGDRTCPELEEHVHCRNCPVFARAARGFFDRGRPRGISPSGPSCSAGPVERGPTDAASLLVFRLGRRVAGAGALGRRRGDRAPAGPPGPPPDQPGLLGPGEPPGAVAALRLAPRPARRRPARPGGPPAGEPPAGRDPPRTRSPGPSRPRRWPASSRVPRDRLQKVPSTLANPAGSFGRAVFAWGDGRSVDVLDEPRVFAALRRMGG